MTAQPPTVRSQHWQARIPFFYGWVIVAVSFWMGLIGGGQSWATGVLSLPMEQDTGWSRSAIFGALTLRSYLGAVVAPFIGPWFDRPNGVQIISLVSGTTMAIGLYLITLAQTELEFILLFGVLGGISAAGQAGAIFSSIVPKWFVSRRGTALTYATMGSGVAALLIPPVVSVLVDAVGWRETWVIFAALSFLTAALPAVLLRRQPEDVGLLPDGAAQPPPAAAGQQPVVRTEQKSWTLGEALHSPLFWILLFGVSLGTFNNGGVPASLVPMYVNKELPRDLAVWGFSIYGMFSIMGRFGWGYLLNRMHIRWVLMGMAIMGLVSTPLYLLLEGPPVLVYSAFTGFSVGGYVAFSQSIWADYYGRAHLGAIAGFAHPFRTLINGGGPVIMALCFDTFGNYGPAMWLVMLCWGLCAAALLAADPKRESAAPR